MQYLPIGSLATPIGRYYSDSLDELKLAVAKDTVNCGIYLRFRVIFVRLDSGANRLLFLERRKVISAFNGTIGTWISYCYEFIDGWLLLR